MMMKNSFSQMTFSHLQFHFELLLTFTYVNEKQTSHRKRPKASRQYFSAAGVLWPSQIFELPNFRSFAFNLFQIQNTIFHFRLHEDFGSLFRFFFLKIRRAFCSDFLFKLLCPAIIHFTVYLVLDTASRKKVPGTF